MIRATIATLLVAFSLASGGADNPSTQERLASQGIDARLSSVRNTALSNSRSYEWLRELTRTSGPRLTGSPGAAAATRWALKTMHDIGLQHVHAERWQLAHGWQRGSATARLISPADQALTVTSYGWCGSTSAPSVDASVVEATWDRYEEFRNAASSWAGRIVLLTNGSRTERDALIDNAHLGEVVSLATKAGAVGIITRNARPTPPLLHTDPVAFGSAAACLLPVLDIAPVQEEMLVHLLDTGQPVRIRLSVHNTFSPGPVSAANVVGDIPGAQRPDDLIVVGAHLDSWDLAVGAADDGVGVATVLAAADALVRSGLRPKRTIRVVLFSGEEQGLLGSRAWLDTHRAALGNVVAVLMMDWGPGAITGVALAGHDELAPDLKQITAAMSPATQIRVRDGYLTYTDAYSFTLAGLPGMAVIQDSANYAGVGHSDADTLDAVDPEILVRDSAIFGMLALGLADYATRHPYPWSIAATSHRLEQDGQLETLRLLGMWPPRDCMHGRIASQLLCSIK
ncbi:MAG TPA: M20/M25/M40 family metallo-hydrolase [Steroidobacteraceae bacterium]